MSEFYHPASRQLQDRFDTRRLADRLEERIVGDTLSEDDRALIERTDMFFLATADRSVPELSSLRPQDAACGAFSFRSSGRLQDASARVEIRKVDQGRSTKHHL